MLDIYTYKIITLQWLIFAFTTALVQPFGWSVPAIFVWDCS